METQNQIIQTSKGWFVASNDSHIGRWVDETGTLTHDNFLPALVCEHLKPGDCILDIGANIGGHSLSYSKAVGEKGMVISCEAGKLTFEILKANVELFPFKNCFPIHTCISEVDGESATWEGNENLGASTCNLVDPKLRVAGETYLMTTTIDFLVNQSERKCDFIKLDIEGFEVKALVGASKTLRDHKPGLLIEINQGALEKQGDTPQDVFDALDFHSYNWEIVQPECKLGDPQYDILCLPAEPNSRF